MINTQNKFLQNQIMQNQILKNIGGSKSQLFNIFNINNREFIKNFIFFICFFSISFFFLMDVYKKNKNPVITSENNTILIILIFLIGFIIKSLLEKSINKESYQLIGVFSFAIFIQWLINYLIEYNDKLITKPNEPYENYFKKLGLIITSTIGIVVMALFAINYLFKNSTQNNIFDAFNEELKFDFYYYLIFVVLIAVYRLHFGSSYSNTTKSSLVLPSILGIYILFIILIFIIYVGIKIKLINTNQILTTIIILSCLFSLFVYVWLYMVIDSINGICKNKKNTEDSKKGKITGILYKFLTPILLFSIFILIWIIDSKKWNRVECILYLIITLILFTSSSTISTNYPNSSLLVFWLTIEWIFVTYYNWINVKNSFQCAFNN